MLSERCILFFFFFNDTATTEIYTLSLHDALLISPLLTPARYVDERWPLVLPHDPHLASLLTEKLEHPVGVRRREHDRNNDRCPCGPQFHGTGMGLEELLHELPRGSRTALRPPYPRDH